MLNIIMDEIVYLDTRILADDALAKLIRKRKDAQENDQAIDKAVVIEKMETLLDSPQPPFLNEAIRKSLKMIIDK